MINGIAERNQMDETLQDANQFNIEIISQAGEGIVVYDRNLCYVVWNRFMERLTGALAKDVLGRKALDLFPHLQEQGVDQLLKRALNGETITSSDTPFHSPFTDQKGWVVGTYAPHRNALGEIIGVIATVRDITERKRTELALRESEDRYRIVVSSASDGIILQESTGRILTWNKAVEKVFGVKAEEVLDHTSPLREWRTIREDGSEFPGAEHPSVQTLTTGEPCKNVVMGVRNFTTDQLSWINISTSPLFREGEPKPYAVVISFYDITERERTEKALLESEERYRAFFKTSRDCVFITSADGRWVDLNDAAVQFFGYDNREDLLKAEIKDLYANPNERTRHLQVINKKGYTQEYPVILRKKDGTLIDTLITSVIRKDSIGRIIGYQGTIRDITECKNVEETLKNSEQEKAAVLSGLNNGSVEYLDPQMRIIWVNDAVQESLGLSVKEMQGKYCFELIEGLKAPCPGCTAVIACKTGESQKGELVTPDGKTWISCSNPLKDSLGQVAGVVHVAINITERKQAEEALRASHQMIEDIINAIPVRVFWKDRDLVYLGCNAIFAQDAGFADPKDIVGKDDYQMGWRDQAELYRNDDRQVIESGRSKLLIEEPQTTPKGNTIVLLTSKVPLRNSKGDIIGVLGTHMDITDRKQMEEALVSEKERLEVVTQNIGAGLALISRDYRTLWANKVLQDIFGECVGKVCYTNYNQREEICPGCGAREIFDIGAEKAVHEQVGRDLAGNIIWSQIIATPLRDKGGNITAVLELVVPITERKRAQIIRERSLVRQEQLNLLQQTLLSPGGLEQKLKLITDSVVEIFGADFCRIWITGLGDLCHVGCIHATITEGPHVCRYRDRCLRLIASSGRYTHTDGEVHRRVPFGCYKIGRVASGDEHKFLTNDVQNNPRVHDREWAMEIGLVSFAGYQLRPPDGDTLGVLALFSKQNITAEDDAQLDSLSNTITRVIRAALVDEELRQSRDELEQRVKERTEELARKNTEMERFIYTVSHDLRTPLISVSGLLGFIEQDAQKGDLDRLKNDLRIADEAVAKMDQLLMRTLELSRIGRVINPPEDVPFEEIVEDALGQTSEKIRSKGFKVSVAQNLPAVQVDRMRIAEVLVNLIENSIKYNGLQANPEIEIGQRIHGKDRIFFVRDNGIGIEPSQYDKVFELFYKVNKQSEGTGAGLAIVKRIIEVHGGRIWIESELGKGCTVCFTLAPARPG